MRSYHTKDVNCIKYSNTTSEFLCFIALDNDSSNSASHLHHLITFYYLI